VQHLCGAKPLEFQLVFDHKSGLHVDFGINSWYNIIKLSVNMKGVDSMRILKEVLAAAALVVLVTSLTFAGRLEGSAGKSGRYTVYDSKNKCQVVCQGERSFFETLESGLAYVLDVPLAILSPIACPIIKPVMDRIDPVEERSYRASSRK
jgi:hypothetical protein